MKSISNMVWKSINNLALYSIVKHLKIKFQLIARQFKNRGIFQGLSWGYPYFNACPTIARFLDEVENIEYSNEVMDLDSRFK